jgi:hypothetical protein
MSPKGLPRGGMMWGENDGEYMDIWFISSPKYENPYYEKEMDLMRSSLKKGISRFWNGERNLIELGRKYDDNKLTIEERKFYEKNRFLLDIRKGDWLVNINMPEWGFCTAGVVKETYKHDNSQNNIIGGNNSESMNYSNTITLDKNTMRIFRRNDRKITQFSARLKLQGAHWTNDSWKKESEEFIRLIQEFHIWKSWFIL